MQILAGKDDGAQVRGLLGASVNRNQMSKATCGGSPCAEHSCKPQVPVSFQDHLKVTGERDARRGS